MAAITAGTLAAELLLEALGEVGVGALEDAGAFEQEIKDMPPYEFRRRILEDPSFREEAMRVLEESREPSQPEARAEESDIETAAPFLAAAGSIKDKPFSLRKPLTKRTEEAADLAYKAWLEGRFTDDFLEQQLKNFGLESVGPEYKNYIRKFLNQMSKEGVAMATGATKPPRANFGKRAGSLQSEALKIAHNQLRGALASAKRAGKGTAKAAAELTEQLAKNAAETTALTKPGAKEAAEFVAKSAGLPDAGYVEPAGTRQLRPDEFFVKGSPSVAQEAGEDVLKETAKQSKIKEMMKTLLGEADDIDVVRWGKAAKSGVKAAPRAALRNIGKLGLGGAVLGGLGTAAYMNRDTRTPEQIAADRKAQFEAKFEKASKEVGESSSLIEKRNMLKELKKLREKQMKEMLK